MDEEVEEYNLGIVFLDVGFISVVTRIVSEKTSTGTRPFRTDVRYPELEALLSTRSNRRNGSLSFTYYDRLIFCCHDITHRTTITMSGAPTWLSTEAPVHDVQINDAVPTTSGIVATQSASAPVVTSMEVSGAEAAEADAELPRMILFMRLANLGVAGAMIACSVSIIFV
jgi:hypothetical protein